MSFSVPPGEDERRRDKEKKKEQYPRNQNVCVEREERDREELKTESGRQTDRERHACLGCHFKEIRRKRVVDRSFLFRLFKKVEKSYSSAEDGEVSEEEEKKRKTKRKKKLKEDRHISTVHTPYTPMHQILSLYINAYIDI